MTSQRTDPWVSGQTDVVLLNCRGDSFFDFLQVIARKEVLEKRLIPVLPNPFEMRLSSGNILS